MTLYKKPTGVLLTNTWRILLYLKK